jgi:hypothetical protein
MAEMGAVFDAEAARALPTHRLERGVRAGAPRSNGSPLACAVRAGLSSWVGADPAATGPEVLVTLALVPRIPPAYDLPFDSRLPAGLRPAGSAPAGIRTRLVALVALVALVEPGRGA